MLRASADYTLLISRAYLTSMALTNWINSKLTGMGLDEISARFYDSSEFRELYGAPDNTAYVDALYSNIFRVVRAMLKVQLTGSNVSKMEPHVNESC